MRNLAHIAKWRHGEGLGFAVLAPQNETFHESYLVFRERNLASYVSQSGLYFFDPSLQARVVDLIHRVYGSYICAICILLDRPPCWYWRESHRNLGVHSGQLDPLPMEIPDPYVDRNRIYQAASTGRNETLNSLMAGSPSLRAAMNVIESNTRQVNRRPARQQEAQAPVPVVAPTPAGTIRCSHCGQVIPPGFKKDADTKRTEDELYAECEHDFNEIGVCKICNLPRKAGRFELLEVD